MVYYSTQDITYHMSHTLPTLLDGVAGERSCKDWLNTLAMPYMQYIYCKHFEVSRMLAVKVNSGFNTLRQNAVGNCTTKGPVIV